MITANRLPAPVGHRVLALLSSAAVAALATDARAAGTAVGTIIENTATVELSLDGNPLSLQSNTTTITVAERIDAVVTLQSPQVTVAASDTNRALLFTVTNTGNGNEAFALAIDSNLEGDDFDPAPATISIYFDTDGSGDFNVGDEAYVPGSNEPVLAADASIDVFLVNDIPGAVTNGQLGFSQLTATAVTGSDVPGTVFPGGGDGGTDAVMGATGGEGAAIGEYLVAETQVSVVKAQAVSDPFGGTEPVPGATIRYTITVEVMSTGIATDSELSDPIPTNSTYVPNSIMLNGVSITDATDTDAGEFTTSSAPTVVVRLGDLQSADGIQTVEFDVTID